MHDVLFHSPRPFVRLRRRYYRRSYDDGFTLNKRSRWFDRNIDVHVPLKSKPLYWLAALGTHLVIIRTFVDDRCVVVGDIGDVGGLIDDSDIAFRRQDRGLNPLRAKLPGCDEGILVRPDVVIVIRPIVDAGALIEPRFRGQRRPADVIVALAPRNPGRRPFIARNPDPADSTQTRPAPVMIGRPAEWLFRNPSPAGVGVNPATVRVRTPTPRAFGLARLPNIPVISGL